jgi:hypothetical protein
MYVFSYVPILYVLMYSMYVLCACVYIIWIFTFMYIHINLIIRVIYMIYIMYVMCVGLVIYVCIHVRWVSCHHGMARPLVADVRWVPCHHGMARPLVADGGDGLQVCRVTETVLNKQSRRADKGWSSSLGVGRRANNCSP